MKLQYFVILNYGMINYILSKKYLIDSFTIFKAHNNS